MGEKTYKTKIDYKKVIHKIDYRFVTKFKRLFCIAAFYIVTRFGRDDFGIYFLWCKHNCHFFIGVVHSRLVAVATDVVVFVAADVMFF